MVSTNEKPAAERILGIPETDNDEARGNLEDAERALRAGPPDEVGVSRSSIRRVLLTLLALAALALLIRKLA